MCGVAVGLECGFVLLAISVRSFVSQYYVEIRWCRVYWDVEVVVAVQGRHVKMYSPRKTWESSQPYGWQASRAGGLEERKLGRTPIWESDKLVLTFVFGWLRQFTQGYLARDVTKGLFGLP